MPESIKALKFVHDYAQTLFEKRKKKNFEESLKTPIFEGEETAYNLFIHSINTLYWAMKIIDNPEAVDGDISLKLDPESTAPLHEQLLDLFSKGIEAFEEVRTNFKEVDLKNTFKSPFGREMTYEDWFGFVIHHTIGHIYQAFRLQAIYLRQKKKGKL